MVRQRRKSDSSVINGVKHFATNGSGWERKGPHLYTLTTRTDLSRDAKGALSIIAIPDDTSGIRVGKIENKIDLRLHRQPEVIFEDVRVPRENLIGTERDGIPIITRAFGWNAALIGAACVGAMRAAFDYVLDFARSERRLGSEPIINHQIVGYTLADIKMRIEACRYLT